MKLSPGPGDVVNDQEFERMLRSICARPDTGDEVVRSLQAQRRRPHEH